VNAYAEPLVSLDLDLVIAAKDLAQLTPILRAQFAVEEFPHSLNVSAPGSQLRVQIQTDPKYLDFLDRAERREVLGLELSVASLGDLVAGKDLGSKRSHARRHKTPERYPGYRPLN
jgi:hypothetical protein